MKKSYLTLAAVAVIMASCSETNEVKNGANEAAQEAAISFDQFTESVTKAAITSESDLKTPGFGVFGYKTNDDFESSQTIFDNVKVYSESATGTADNEIVWKYDNLRFWDKTATYNFYAIAPFEAATANYNISNDPKTGMFTIDNVASAISSSSKDYLIDRDGNKDVSGNYSGTHAKVPFEFHHTMAKVDFKLKSTLSSGTIEVTSVKMTGWNSGAGKFVQTLTATPTTLEHSEWTIATAGTGDITLVGTGATQTTVALTCATDATPTTVTDWYIMVPQTVAANGLTFTVDYIYKDGDYTETFKNQVAKISAAQIWGTDSHTTYTLDIKPAAIEFDVTSVCNFCVDGNATGNNDANGTVN